MQFFHGVYPVEIDTIKTLEDQYRQMETIGKKYDLWKTGETLMVLSGPLGITGGTNLLKVHTVGE
jgi:pyruvate kinase